MENMKLLIITFLFIIFLFCGCDFTYYENVQKQEYTKEIELSPLYSVERVVDGDTIVVLIQDERTKIRLIGIDTPESVHSDASKNTEEGKQVSKWLVDLLEDGQVYLEYDVSQKDRFGRTLAYVYLSDKETMVNRLLLEKGYAKTMNIKPNCKYADEFKEIQNKAKESKEGFWKTGYFK